ncbi:oxygenase MpaB family protein [Nocardiopsis flavescens]|uniref:ER-bound oxygenase mpaB/mpaB'/Rubber oxygenase catalytic domain-containing protein n=1 Tax=Nocardiopsis flavescens TaxID=758803 RepID=A0A1M6NYT5_9ACTN|nr:oxygenase MpaB family protein [Nocardiopsis flavescens]SHK00897.1 hypothetical protein SAMN05421803_112173 [Nocardiopsis flavescens]
MYDPTRRKVLAAGGLLGALGAMGMMSPARARTLTEWSWPAGDSVAGSGPGVDPHLIWDAKADPVVSALLDDGVVPQVNELLRKWTRNDQPLPQGLPRDLRDFMEEARELPSWTDQDKLATAVEFNEKRGLYLGVLYGLASGMMSTVIPQEALAVYYSKGGADMKTRIAKTAKLGYDIGASNAYKPDGEMVVTAVKTRLVHAAVRHLLPQSPRWAEVAPEEVPISQADIMVTWHSLPTTVMQKLAAWEVPIPEEESEAFLHTWQIGAHMLGVDDEYIPATWEAADDQAAQVLDPILAPTREGVDLADILLGLGEEVDLGIISRPVLGSFTRFMLGDEIAGWLEIPREPFWDRALDTFWDPFVAVREGALDRFPGTSGLYWTFDEFLRRAALLFLSEAKPISIEIPTHNRPE